MNPGSRRGGRQGAAALGVAMLWLAGCGEADHGYYPLQGDRQWLYRVSVEYKDEVIERRMLIRNLGSLEYQGQQLQGQYLQSGAVNLMRIDDGAVLRVASRRSDASDFTADDPPQVVLPAEPRIGDEWLADSRLVMVESRTFDWQDRLVGRFWPVQLRYRIEALDDTVVVPAGRFSGCLRVRAVGEAWVPIDRGTGKAPVAVEGLDWYAPGVGLVKTERVERSDSRFLFPGRYLQELERVSP